MFSFILALGCFILAPFWSGRPVGNSKYQTDDISDEAEDGEGRHLNRLGQNKHNVHICGVHGRPGVTNDGVDLTPHIRLSTQTCSGGTKQGIQETWVPLPAGFWRSADASPAPALAP